MTLLALESSHAIQFCKGSTYQYVGGGEKDYEALLDTRLVQANVPGTQAAETYSSRERTSVNS